MAEEIEKYNPIWLRRNCLNSDFHHTKLTEMEQIIANCKMSVIKMMIKDENHFEAILPVISKYRFEYKPGMYYAWPMNEVTIYLK